MQLPKIQAHDPWGEKIRSRQDSEHSNLGDPFDPRRVLHFPTRGRVATHLEEFRGLREARYPWVALKDGRLSPLWLAVFPGPPLAHLGRTVSNCCLVRVGLLKSAALDSPEIPDSSMRKNQHRYHCLQSRSYLPFDLEGTDWASQWCQVEIPASCSPLIQRYFLVCP